MPNHTPRHEYDRRPTLVDLGIFAVTLLVADGLWKLCVSGDESGSEVTLLGWDITALFEWMSLHIAATVYTLIHWSRDTIQLIEGYILRFDSGTTTSVVWSCTPVKQAFIWLMLIVTTLGGWKHKSWVIPVGWILIYGINIVRITVLSLLIEFHPEWFHLLHDYVFKYIFYGLMFLMWWTFVRWFAESALGQAKSLEPRVNGAHSE